MTHGDEHPYRSQSAFAFMTERDLASRWKVSGRTLQRWRSESYGPVWTSIGGSIRYPVAGVLAFEAAGRSGGGRS